MSLGAASHRRSNSISEMLAAAQTDLFDGVGLGDPGNAPPPPPGRRRSSIVRTLLAPTADFPRMSSDTLVRCFDARC